MFFDKRKYKPYILYTLLLIFITILVLRLMYDLLGEREGIPDLVLWLQDFTNVCFFLVSTTGFQYVKRGLINQYQLQELRAKTAETELNALKAQINPHFLFNTLNNIYAINKIDSEQGGEMLLELSEVMRYHLRFSKMKEVNLEEELQLIKAYIELEKLRLTKNCELITTFEPINERLKIAPLLFLPFIENAFKHGTHPVQKSFVHLSITSTENKVHFEVSNSIIHNKKVVKTNIGLENTKRRLDIIYPKQHDLKISETDDRYIVNLIIEI